MSRQVEKFTAWVVATLGVALAWAGICFALTYGSFRWFSAPGICGFAYLVIDEWSDLGDCLALPAREGEALQQSGELHQSN